MATHTTLTSLFSDIADSIREKTGDTESIIADEFPEAIENIPSGGGEIPEHGVFFMDYDGTLVDAWETSIVTSKTELPTNPTHTGLIAQGWNWALNDIKDYIEDYPETNVYVGQMYATASGLTEMDITLTKVAGLSVTCKMSGNKNWGDGTTDNLTTHTYTDYGNYTIACDGTIIPSGTSSSGGMFSSSSSNVNRYWCTAIRIGGSVTSIGDAAFRNCYSLQSITIPNSVTSIGGNVFRECYSLQSITIPNGVTSIESSAFYNCYSLQSITIPNGVTSIIDDTFYSCYSLQSITIPNGVTSIGESVFRSCYSLQSITIPNGATSIGGSAFYSCYSLQSITIPNGVTSIGDMAFNRCHSIIKYDFSNGSSIPALENTNAFSYINAISKIIVPDTLYDDWIVATNWSTYADYIYKASEVEE